jgi:uncharacterized CHY-type Zn-finger protein
VYYACRECHDALADHPVLVWPMSEWDQAAILCGACGMELSVKTYLAATTVARHARRGSIRRARSSISSILKGA